MSCECYLEISLPYADGLASMGRTCLLARAPMRGDVIDIDRSHGGWDEDVDEVTLMPAEDDDEPWAHVALVTPTFGRLEGMADMRDGYRDDDDWDLTGPMRVQDGIEKYRECGFELLGLYTCWEPDRFGRGHGHWTRPDSSDFEYEYFEPLPGLVPEQFAPALV